MRYLEHIKLVIGLVLVLFPIIAGFIFVASLFDFFNFTLSELFLTHPNKKVIDQISPNTLLYLGLCAVSGAYLLASIKKRQNSNGKY